MLSLRRDAHGPGALMLAFRNARRIVELHCYPVRRGRVTRTSTPANAPKFSFFFAISTKPSKTTLLLQLQSSITNKNLHVKHIPNPKLGQYVLPQDDSGFHSKLKRLCTSVAGLHICNLQKYTHNCAISNYAKPYQLKRGTAQTSTSWRLLLLLDLRHCGEGAFYGSWDVPSTVDE